jgi:hypothetical protein
MIDTMLICLAPFSLRFAQKHNVHGASIRRLLSSKGQWHASDVTDCFDQEPYGPRIPIDPIDGRFPILGQHMGGVARFHAQPRDRARRRLHDRPFDRGETGEGRLDLFRESFAADFFAETLNVTIEFCGWGVESFLES